MLSTMRSSWFLFALFALFALSSALNIGDMNLDGIEEYLNNGVKRQAQGTGNTPTTAATPSPTPDPPTTSEAPSSAPPPSSQPGPTTTPPPTTTAAPTSNGQQSSNPPRTSNPDPNPGPSSSSPPSSSSLRQSFTTETTPLVSTSDQVFVTTFTTKSNGQDVIASSTGTSKIVTTTGQATVTKGLETQGGGGGGSSSGLSDKNKSIIGGVVGGVGGALLLGGIALVCWRIWGRKNRVNEDDADLMAGTGSALGDKSHSSNQSPFQTNLEQYHNGTGGRPNAAANF